MHFCWRALIMQVSAQCCSQYQRRLVTVTFFTLSTCVTLFNCAFCARVTLVSDPPSQGVWQRRPRALDRRHAACSARAAVPDRQQLSTQGWRSAPALLCCQQPGAHGIPACCCHCGAGAGRSAAAGGGSGCCASSNLPGATSGCCLGARVHVGDIGLADSWVGRLLSRQWHYESCVFLRGCWLDVS